MKVSCPSCKTISEIELPVLLAVCACGALVRARVRTETPTAQTSTNQRIREVTHYEVLGVPESASADEIKSAYRRRAKETHPDAGGDADDFKLVQSAWEVLGDSSKRQQYDQRSLIGQQSASVTVPDLIGMSTVQAVKKSSIVGVIVRVLIVEVEPQSKLHGRVIGQYPYPEQSVESNIVGVVVAISRNATIWQRIGTITSDLAVGFWTGLISTTVGSNSPQRELGEQSTSRNVGEFVGETVGEIATGAAQATLGFLSCVGYIFLVLVTLLTLLLNPGLGFLFLALTAYVVYKDRNKRSSSW